MKTKNDYLNAGLTRTDLNMTTVEGYFRDMDDQLFSKSPIVHGDHKRPNAWWYNKTFSRKMKGSASYFGGVYGGNYNNPWVCDFSGMIQNLPDVTPDYWKDVEGPYNKALGKLNDKVRGGLDISVAIAESHQTNKMLKSIHKAERYISGFGPRRWANEWLEYKYGWKPLLSDVYDAANELIAVNNIHTIFKGKAHSHIYPRFAISSPGSVDVSSTGYETLYQVKTNIKAEAWNSVHLEVELALPNSAARAARWSSLNPVSIAWELTPYSFVVDWFLDIGSYLRDLESSWLYQSMFKSGFRSNLYWANSSGSCSYSNKNSREYFSCIHGIQAKSTMQRIVFERILLNSYPCPNLPRVNTDLSSGRLITAAALLMQFIHVPKPVMARWMDVARPFISYGKLKKPKFAFKAPQRWTHELEW
jgi:hypothetical protein